MAKPNDKPILPALGFPTRDPTRFLAAIDLLLRTRDGHGGHRVTKQHIMEQAAQNPRALPEEIRAAQSLPLTCAGLIVLLNYWLPELTVFCDTVSFTPQVVHGRIRGKTRRGWRLRVWDQDDKPLASMDTARRFGNAFYIYRAVADYIRQRQSCQPTMDHPHQIRLPLRCKKGLVLLLTQNPSVVEVTNEDLRRVGERPHAAGPLRLDRFAAEWRAEAVSKGYPILIASHTQMQKGERVAPTDIDTIAGSWDPVQIADEVFGYDLKTNRLYLLKSRDPRARPPCEVDQNGPLRMTVLLDLEYREATLRSQMPQGADGVLAALRGEDLPTPATREEILRALARESIAPGMPMYLGRLEVQSVVPEAEEPELKLSPLAETRMALRSCLQAMGKHGLSTLMGTCPEWATAIAQAEKLVGSPTRKNGESENTPPNRIKP